MDTKYFSRTSDELGLKVLNKMRSDWERTSGWCSRF